MMTTSSIHCNMGLGMLKNVPLLWWASFQVMSCQIACRKPTKRAKFWAGRRGGPTEGGPPEEGSGGGDPREGGLEQRKNRGPRPPFGFWEGLNQTASGVCSNPHLVSKARGGLNQLPFGLKGGGGV